jgi:hypothetical protein
VHKRVDPSYTIGFDPAAGAKKKDLYPEVGPTGRCDTLGEATLQDSIPRGGGAHRWIRFRVAGHTEEIDPQGRQSDLPGRATPVH